MSNPGAMARFGGALPPLPPGFPVPSQEQLQKFMEVMRQAQAAGMPVPAFAPPMFHPAPSPRASEEDSVRQRPAVSAPRVNSRGNWTPQEVT